MKSGEIKKELPMLVYIFPENREVQTSRTRRKIERYDYYKTNGYAGKRKERLALIFGSFILFTAFASFIALIVMTVLI
ncbi:hypothetical protein [Flavobacterium sp. FlaQc-48]|uniref:hypothetical protein n=1 Tax=Flavobacterium sp. FlaQc-48 TaxID=3374181 RepID=UPI003757B5E2